MAAALFAGAALAADTSSGSKNFAVPTTVPNYFSNESGPMIGGAAETRRGELYSGQAQPVRPSAPVATAAPAQATTLATVTAATPRQRQHIAMAEPRGRLVRGHYAAPALAHRIAAHGRMPAHVASRGGSHVTHVVSRVTTTHAAGRPATHAVSKTTRVTSAHHARG
jgi:hypothetical protein